MRRLAVLLIFVTLAASNAVAQDAADSMRNDIPTLAVVEVGAYSPVAGVDEALGQYRQYLDVPMESRSRVDVSFYLHDGKGRRIGFGGGSNLRLRAVRQDGSVMDLSGDANGRVAIPDDLLGSGQRFGVEVNSAKDGFVLKARPGIRFGAGNEMALDALNLAADQFFDIYKQVYAGGMFKRFIKDRKANCTGYVFVDPSVVKVYSPSEGRVVWESGKSSLVVMFESDVLGAPVDSVVQLSSSPSRVSACLVDKEKWLKKQG